MKELNKNKVELLAPAGDYMSFIAAVNAGADAIYMGVDKFNARIMTENFTLEEYIKCIDYAHKRDVKIYLTINTLVLSSEIKELLDIVEKLYKAGLDAVIVQDLGLASLLRLAFPNLALHASTQMSVLNLSQVKFLEKLGFKRVVLGRELSIEEIHEIAKNTDMEIEVFVHGALCVSVSGACMASKLIGNRSANRGNCAQPCRMQYTLYNGNKKIIENKYILSKKDIFGINLLKKLKLAGVTSFKIEGRNKSPEYVSGITRRYRKCIDNDFEVNKKDEKDILQLFNRSGKSAGYLEGIKYKSSISFETPKNTGICLGHVLDNKKSYIKVKLMENIDLHDGIEILSKNKKVSTIVTCIRDENFEIVNTEQEKGKVVYIGDVKEKVEKGSIIYKTSSNKLNERERLFITNNKRLNYDVCVYINLNKKIKAVSGKINYELEYMPEKSIKNSLKEERIKEVFSKTENTAVRFNNIQVYIDDEVFVPVSILNDLRRNLVEKIEESKCIRNKVDESKIKDALSMKIKKHVLNNKNSLYVYNFHKDVDYKKVYYTKFNKKLDRLYIAAKDFKNYTEDILKYKNEVDIYFVIPCVLLKNTQEYIEKNLESLVTNGVKGIVLGNLGLYDKCVKLKEKYKIVLVGDYYLNITNEYTLCVLDKLDYVAPLFEDNVDLDKLNKYTNIEMVEGVVTAMTTRYCMLASFVEDKEDKKGCKSVCLNGNYKIVDKFKKEYNLITDNTDCITQIVRNKPKMDIEQNISIRYNILG